MIAGFRRIRLLAFLLLAGTPGLGGLALQTLHPCPAEMPWLPVSGGHHAHHAAGDEAATDEGASGACHCIGSCSISAPAGLAATTPALAQSSWVDVSLASHRVAHAPVLLPIDRFPPKTAPPLLG